MTVWACYAKLYAVTNLMNNSSNLNRAQLWKHPQIPRRKVPLQTCKSKTPKKKLRKISALFSAWIFNCWWKKFCLKFYSGTFYEGVRCFGFSSAKLSVCETCYWNQFHTLVKQWMLMNFSVNCKTMSVRIFSVAYRQFSSSCRFTHYTFMDFVHGVQVSDD